MKKVSYFLASLVLLFLLNSCGKQETFVGKFETDQKYRNELSAEKGNPEAVFAYIVLNQKVEYEFKNDMSFSKTFIQNYTDLEIIEESYLPENFNENIKSYLDKEIKFRLNGTYIAKNGKIQFKTKTITYFTETEEEITNDYEEYYNSNPTVENPLTEMHYKKSEQELILSYPKSEEKIVYKLINN